MKVNSMNKFTDFKFINYFKMIINIMINFKFFYFILQISLNSNDQLEFDIY